MRKRITALVLSFVLAFPFATVFAATPTGKSPQQVYDILNSYTDAIPYSEWITGE